MATHGIGRRSAVAGGLAAGLAATARAQDGTVRWSTGTERPRTKAPPNATDCHFHTYDRRYPAVPGATLLPEDASPADYRALQARIGTTRGVVIQPSTYGTDNSLQLASMQALGPDRFRMVAVVAEDVPDAELERLHGLGVRGVRFNLTLPGVLTPASLPVLAPRLAAHGMHCQVNMNAKQLADGEAMLAGLPNTLVFDHLGQVPQPAGTDSPSFAIVRRLLDSGRAYVKLSGAYITSKEGPPGYADAGRVAAAYSRTAPDRVVWGSDWPHPTAPVDHKPDDAVLFDRLAEWAGGEAQLHRILVENPARLYGFPA